jgi:hypothetical protein
MSSKMSELLPDYIALHRIEVVRAVRTLNPTPQPSHD